MWQQFLAIPNAELPAKQLHDLFGRTGVGERPPLLSGFRWTAGVHDAGKFLVGHREVGERLPVFEHGIESGHVLSNQLPLEDEGGLGGLSDNAFDVVGPRHQFRNHVAVGVAGKVGANALVEARGLTDIEDSALGVFEEVDARFVWQVSRSQVHGHASTTPAMTQKANPVSRGTQREGCLMKEAAEPFLSPC